MVHIWSVYMVRIYGPYIWSLWSIFYDPYHMGRITWSISYSPYHIVHIIRPVLYGPYHLIWAHLIIWLILSHDQPFCLSGGISAILIKGVSKK